MEGWEIGHDGGPRVRRASASTVATLFAARVRVHPDRTALEDATQRVSYAQMVDPCLVTLVEHGLTPSVLATRLVYSSAPEAMQGAVAAGLLAVGSVFVGTVEGCAALLARIVASPDSVDVEAKRVATEHRA